MFHFCKGILHWAAGWHLPPPIIFFYPLSHPASLVVVLEFILIIWFYAHEGKKKNDRIERYLSDLRPKASSHRWGHPERGVNSPRVSVLPGWARTKTPVSGCSSRLTLNNEVAVIGVACLWKVFSGLTNTLKLLPRSGPRCLLFRRV